MLGHPARCHRSGQSGLPRALPILLTALAVAAGVTLPGVAQASAATPRARVTLPVAIDPLQPYVPQDSCDATNKPGAVALLGLLMRTYPGTTDMGISQTCAAEGMTSEHAEGRALDWGVSVHRPAQRGQAEAMLTWLFADQTQPDGTVQPQVMARRLGVMYVIWNARIREAGGSWEPYLPAICGHGRGDDTTCHRNHVHISLGWSGAWMRTSFWTGRVATVDYGPCVAKGKKIAPKYSRFNALPCGTTRHPVHQLPVRPAPPTLPTSLPTPLPTPLPTLPPVLPVPVPLPTALPTLPVVLPTPTLPVVSPTPPVPTATPVPVPTATTLPAATSTRVPLPTLKPTISVR